MDRPTESSGALGLTEPRVPFDQTLGEITQLIRASVGYSRFYEQFLGCLARRYAAPYALLEARIGGALIFHHVASLGDDRFAWKERIEPYLLEGLERPRPFARRLKGETGGALCVLSVPLRDRADRSVGALCLVTAFTTSENVQADLSDLDVLAGMGSLASRSAPAAETRAATTSAAAGETLAKLSRFESETEVAFAITNNLRNKTGSDVAAMGVVRNRRLRVLCVSGVEEVKRNSAATVAFTAAMEECLDMGKPLCFQRGGDVEQRETALLHRQWHEQAQGAAVASVPFEVDGRVEAVLCLQRGADLPFSQEQLEQVRDLVAPFIEGLRLVRRAQRGVLAHGIDNVLQLFGGPARVAAVTRRASWALALAGMLWFLFGELEYNVTAHCRVEPSLVQHVAAPYDGVIRSAPWKAGGAFQKGDILCEFDTSYLELERSRLRSERNIVELEKHRFLAEDDPFQFELARKKEVSYGAMLDLIELQISKAVVVAPFDGFILQGDLRDRVGDATVKGEPLFQLSRAGDWQVELHVPEGEILQLRGDEVGEFVPRARPEDRYGFTVQKIHPAVEIAESKSMVRVEVEPDVRPSWMKPGMEGVAKIPVGKRKVWWVALHSVLDRLRLKFWL